METKDLTEKLRQEGIRPTPQRVAVYDYLLAHPSHPCVDTIYTALHEQYPAFSRTTIYNSLYALARGGLIRVLRIDVQEQRFDGNALDHGHFKCRQCGEIFDFAMDMSALQHSYPPDFSVEVCDMYLVGMCPACGGAHQ